MIRREFMKLVSIATAGMAVFRLGQTSRAIDLTPTSSRRQWLHGSARSGCAHFPDADSALK